MKEEADVVSAVTSSSSPLPTARTKKRRRRHQEEEDEGRSSSSSLLGKEEEEKEEEGEDQHHAPLIQQHDNSSSSIALSPPNSCSFGTTTIVTSTNTSNSNTSNNNDISSSILLRRRSCGGSKSSTTTSEKQQQQQQPMPSPSTSTTHVAASHSHCTPDSTPNTTGRTPRMKSASATNTAFFVRPAAPTSSRTSPSPSSPQASSRRSRTRMVRKLPSRADFSPPNQGQVSPASSSKARGQLLPPQHIELLHPPPPSWCSSSTKKQAKEETNNNRSIPSTTTMNRQEQAPSWHHHHDKDCSSRPLTEDEHRWLVSAIFDVGLTECSPLSIYENMSTRIKDSYSSFNLEKIKSKLQKYRKSKSKNKQAFMQIYQKTLEDMLGSYPIARGRNDFHFNNISKTKPKNGSNSTKQQTHPSSCSAEMPQSIISNLSSGEVAAYLTYKVMEEDAEDHLTLASTSNTHSTNTNGTSSADGDYTVFQHRHHPPYHHEQQDKQQHQSLSSHANYGPLPNEQIYSSLSPRHSSSSEVGNQHLHIMAGLSNHPDDSVLLPPPPPASLCGGALDFPSLTLEELNTPIGKSFQYLLGLLSALISDMYQHRRGAVPPINDIGSHNNLSRNDTNNKNTSSSRAMPPSSSSVNNMPYISANTTPYRSTPLPPHEEEMAAMNLALTNGTTMLPHYFYSSTTHPPFSFVGTSDRSTPLSTANSEQFLQDLITHQPHLHNPLIGTEEAGGAVLLAGLSVAPTNNSDTTNNDEEQKENDTTPKASNITSNGSNSNTPTTTRKKTGVSFPFDMKG